MSQPVRIVFVCLGNICRSAVAEGIFSNLADREGLADSFHIESAGTGGWHIGEKPDARMRKTSLRHGISLEHQRAQQFDASFFDRFDYILAMDPSNLQDIRRLDSKQEYTEKVFLFRSFDPGFETEGVPDPYYGGESGFEEVFQIIDRTSNNLFSFLLARPSE